MLKHFRVYVQYLLPHHFLTVLAGRLANIRHPRIKNWMIHKFIRDYHIDIQEAAEPSLEAYATFNDFFIRQLKPTLRPITSDTNSIASPADGTVAQIGLIRDKQLIQAKNMYFTLNSLLGNDQEAANIFINGNYSTIYLAPHNYHRVHMPLAGKLEKTIYIPGRLFSVNLMTSSLIPKLYARNERLISIFSTEAGPMAIILVGAMIVGSIKTVWMDAPVRENSLVTRSFTSSNIHLEKGAELGYFNLGSTVIVLFGQGKMEWQPSIQTSKTIKYGERMGSLLSFP